MVKLRRIGVWMAVLTVAALVASLGVSAQTGTWVSGIMIQNQSMDHNANITVIFYWAEDQAQSGEAYRFSDTIEAGKSKGYWVPNIAGLPANFVGSAVVESDQPVVANVNTQTDSPGTAQDPNRVGTSSGVLEAGTTLYFTQVMREFRGWNSYLAVQNTTGSTATVTVRYYNDSDGAEVTAAAQTNLTISPFATRIFRQQEHTGLPMDWGGSAVVTSDQPVAGIVNFFNRADTHATAQFHSFNAFTSGGTRLYVPRAVVNYYGYQTGIKVQNVGNAATNVTITYHFAAGTFTQTLSNIQPNAARPVYLATDVPGLRDLAADGAAVIESSGGVPIVATVNEDNRHGNPAAPNHEGRGVTYNAFVAGNETSTLLLSQVTARAGGYSGGIQVQNVGTNPTTVTAVWSMAGRADVTTQATLQPNQSVAWFAPNVVPAGFNSSVVVTASGNQPIVGIANNSFWQTIAPEDNWPVNLGDSFLTYNGVNR